MVRETNRQKLERFFAAFESGDEATQAALLHPDFLIVEADGLPYGGAYHGLAGWQALAAKIFATWSDAKIAPQFILGEDDGDRFAAMHHMKGRSSRSGLPFDTSIFELWSFRDGLIVDIRPHYWDTKMMADIHAAVADSRVV